MKWTLKLVADSGETTVHEVAILNRAEVFINPAALGMSIEESKQIVANMRIPVDVGSDSVAMWAAFFDLA